MTNDRTAELRRVFGGRVSRLRRGCPQPAWARRYGLSAGAVRDLEQGRVLPPRAMVVLMAMLDLCPELVKRVVRNAADDLAALSEVRGARN